ncbi:MAG: rod shape-determining protein MreC [Ferruginibacter sp.]
MRNIFLFIRHYFNFLLFVILQILCLYFIISYSKYHEAAFGNTANQITGKINKRYNSISYYFHLKESNDSLISANEMLYNKLKMDYDLPDSIYLTYIDSLNVDSISKYKKYKFEGAKVVANSVSLPNNYIVLSKGRKDNFDKGMGVISPNNGVVGIITDISDDFSIAMSLLHKDSKISGKILKSGETGTVSWDGKEPNFLTMSGIAKNVSVTQGDTIITSGFSTTFPRGIIIGTVDLIYTTKSSSFIKIRLKSQANFFNLQYGYIINNTQAADINSLIEKAKKQSQ